ncbi:unnamed protein product, partial [Ascophyllum nodosum]
WNIILWSLFSKVKARGEQTRDNKRPVRRRERRKQCPRSICHQIDENWEYVGVFSGDTLVWKTRSFKLRLLARNISKIPKGVGESWTILATKTQNGNFGRRRLPTRKCRFYSPESVLKL